jgi:membrane protease YdiL (CAAX protease family)
MNTNQKKRFAHNLTSWITDNPMLAFLLITFFLTWSLWFMAPLISRDDRYVFDSLVQIGVFGPAFAAWIVSAVMNPQPVRTSTLRKISLFVCAYPISLGIWWLGRQVMMGTATRGHWSDFVLAALPALIISGFASGKQGVHDWLSPLKKWQSAPSSYLLAIFLWPALILAGNALAPILGFSVPEAPYNLEWRLLWLVPLNLLCILFYGGGNEEPGWRGFAQPLLQKKYSPLVAGLMLGFVWALWHVPLNLNGYYSAGVGGLLTRLFTVPYGIFFAWMLNRSKGSLIPVWLLHGMSNNSGAFLPRADIPVFGLGLVLLVALIIKDRMWESIETLPKTEESLLSKSASHRSVSIPGESQVYHES